MFGYGHPLVPRLPEPPESAEDFLHAVVRDDIEFVLAMFVNIDGKPCCKLVPAAAVPELLEEGLGFAGHAAGAIGQSPADPDLVAVPDVSTYTVLPWRTGLAAVMCDPHVGGAPWPYAPRVILRRGLAALADRGMQFKVGAEPEYFLVRRTPGGGIAVADDEDTAELPCYDARGLGRSLDHVAAVSRALTALGWGNYSNDHEDANGQFEHDFAYADALVTADRVILFRYLVQMLAREAGLLATFMPKPFGHLTGSGLHLHMSLWDRASGSELFRGSNDARGLGMSDLGYSFIGGVLAHAPGVVGFGCPTVNSYKRLAARDATASGSSWAPTWATYGGNNRTQMLRVPAPGRVEARCVDSAANPYLAMTALLAAGLDGIDHGMDPGAPNEANLERDGGRGGAPVHSALPATLADAAAAVSADPVLREAFGKVSGGEFVDYYAQLKQSEFDAYHRRVGDWEIERYLTAF
ncbi:type III glutamate--ammonia ligase [Streptomyces gibsoniae]|uniref:Type III glutamate--ammonia ligase n=1 Tax=Streptomyces gibsoniae TaxID=3075529 RepID=A0ABU2TLZ5_9ACTN|nr:type III glutamate--ammonia ligase [Streptomyces sp. DSM 41699]MDT0461966.1 type III glutamate--ammonia ligase [Streptomyces sp. DSM 41699]